MNASILTNLGFFFFFTAMIITTIRIITTSAAPPMINHKRLPVNILPFAESSVAAVGWMFSLSTGMVSWVFNKIAPLLSTFAPLAM